MLYPAIIISKVAGTWFAGSIQHQKIGSKIGLYSNTVKRKTALPEISTSDDGNKNKRHAPSSILIIGGAGGVGSIAIQLAKNLVNDLSSSPELML